MIKCQLNFGQLKEEFGIRRMMMIDSGVVQIKNVVYIMILKEMRV